MSPESECRTVVLLFLERLAWLRLFGNRALFIKVTPFRLAVVNKMTLFGARFGALTIRRQTLFIPTVLFLVSRRAGLLGLGALTFYTVCRLLTPVRGIVILPVYSLHR